MPRWLWWFPLGVLTLVTGLFVYRAGFVASNMTETDVINHYAALYVAEGPEGAQVTDCAALPDPVGAAWLIIRCAGAGGEVTQYRVDRFGRVLQDPPQRAPET